MNVLSRRLARLDRRDQPRPESARATLTLLDELEAIADEFEAFRPPSDLLKLADRCAVLRHQPRDHSVGCRLCPPGRQTMTMNWSGLCDLHDRN